MKRLGLSLILILAVLAGILFYRARLKSHFIWTGAFMTDSPRAADIQGFQNSFGKKPYLATVFIAWNHFLEPEVIGSVYGQGCVLVVTWEPWDPHSKKGIDFDGLLRGSEDEYIARFAEQLKSIDRPVYLRFAHEMNGNWYPWSGTRLGAEKYIRVFRYVKDKLDNAGSSNVKWVFSVNAEDVPRENNHFMQYYPGDAYVDFIGLDGYNWGTSRQDTRWQSFRKIFKPFYEETRRFEKPILITEFSSASSGGDKAAWIRGALAEMETMTRLKGFVLFNIDKEADWQFKAGESSGRALSSALQTDTFTES